MNSEQETNVVQVVPEKKESNFLLWSTGFLLVLMIIATATMYSDYLSSSIIKAKGPRIAVTQGKHQVISLPNANQTKKVEICRGFPTKCNVLSASVKGATAIVKIPAKYPIGSAFLKISERSAANKLTFLYSRAIFVKRAEIAIEDSNGGGSGGSKNGGSNNSNNAPEEVDSSFAVFINPDSQEKIISGQPLDARVQLVGTSATNLTCQQWLLDGKPLTVSDWENGQAPDLSAASCL